MGQEVIGRVVWKHSPSPLLFPFDPWLYRRYISLLFKCAHIVFSLSNLLLYFNWIQKRKKTLSTVHKTWYKFDYGRNSQKCGSLLKKIEKCVWSLLSSAFCLFSFGHSLLVFGSFWSMLCRSGFFHILLLRFPSKCCL